MNRKAELKDRLKQAMAHNNMKPVELSNKTDVPKGAISYYLAGKSKPKSDRVYILSKALNVSEAWLLGYDVPMERTDEQKKNDKLAELIVKLRFDNELFSMVDALASLPEDQRASIKTILTGLSK
jgi:transcriptional regulator with XRE-family HTH domain